MTDMKMTHDDMKKLVTLLNRFEHCYHNDKMVKNNIMPIRSSIGIVKSAMTRGLYAGGNDRAYSPR